MQVCGCYCKMFRGLTFLGHTVCTIQASPVCLCVNSTWDPCYVSVQLLWSFKGAEFCLSFLCNCFTWTGVVILLHATAFRCSISRLIVTLKLLKSQSHFCLFLSFYCFIPSSRNTVGAARCCNCSRIFYCSMQFPVCFWMVTEIWKHIIWRALSLFVCN